MAKPTRPYHHGDLRKALVDASIELLRDSGIEALTLRSAARHVGVSHAAPKNHFGDLRGLLAAVAATGFRDLYDALRAASEAEGTAAERLLATGPAYVRFAVRSPGQFRAMFHPSLADRSVSEELDLASRAAFEALVSAVAAAQAEGSVAEGDTPGKSLAAWSMVHGMASLAVDAHLRGKGIGANPEELASLVTRYLFDGVRSRPSHVDVPAERVGSNRAMTAKAMAPSPPRRKKKGSR